MTAIELAARPRLGLAGLFDWRINQATAAQISRHPPDRLAIPGLALHFLHGLVAGLVFAVIVPLFLAGWPILAVGAAYGVLLFGLTLAAYGPVTGSSWQSISQNRGALGLVLLTHVAYGVTVALLIIWP